MAEKKKPKAKPVGKITHFYSKINVAVVEITAPLAKGDEIQIKGTTTDFKQKVNSMQVEHKEIEKAKKGDAIGMLVKEKVREGDLIYKV